MTTRLRRRRSLAAHGHPARREEVRARPLAGGGRGPIEPPDATLRRLDDHIDERLDGEATKSSVAILLSAFAVLMAAVAGITIFVVASEDGGGSADAAASAPAPAADEHAHATSAPAADISAAAAEGIEFEKYQRPDPTLPGVPAGEVKEFRVDVYEHVTKVSDELAPTRVWSYGVNGKLNRGTGVSQPIVVNEGDEVKMTLVNGGSEAMDVQMPHSIDFHSAEVAPNEAFATIPPGESHTFEFTADHPGVFMYHCATDPVLMHTGAGMAGMMVVRPKGLAPADHELWMTQQEFFIGEPGGEADLAKMEAREPDVIAFNGYAAQYKNEPIAIGSPGETVRMFVLNAGPSEWSAFHVIGTVFDKTMVEGTAGRDAQTINLAPSQGGYVEFTLDDEGAYPFVSHSFGDMVKGAVGVLATDGAADEAMAH